MSRLLVAVLAVAVLNGCASDPARRENIVKQHAAGLPAPTEPLSSYNQFELKPLQVSEAIAND
jgi:hypothetical protein